MGTPTGPLLVSVRRPDDLLVLTLEGLNLQVGPDPDGGTRVTRVDENAPAHLVVHLPPQHIAERAYLQTDPNNTDPANPVPAGGETPDPPPISARAAEATRLVFRWPDDLRALPYRLADLLAWDRLEPVTVDVTAGPPRPPRDGQGDGPPETAIELPYRLVLSPDTPAGWSHPIEAAVLGDRVELWGTSLVVPPAGPDASPDDPVAVPPVRAVWSPDYTGEPPAVPPPHTGHDLGVGRSSLGPNDRHQIVRLTSDTTMATFVRLANGQLRRVPVPPVPLAVEELTLTALGGTLRSRGDWSALPLTRLGLDLSQWRHVAVGGRDEYVRVVNEGVLWPTRHPAALVTVTERMFQHAGAGPVTAYLRQRLYVLVRQPERAYAAGEYPHGGREAPLRTITLTTRLTPSIDDKDLAPSFVTPNAFRVNVGGAPFAFHATALDVEGRALELTIPSVFVFGTATPADVAAVQAQYAADDDRRRSLVPGLPVAYAERDPGRDGDTVLTTNAFYLTAVAPAGAALDPGTFLPALDAADVRVHAVEEVTGRPGAVRIRPFPGYLDGGFGAANEARVFAAIDAGGALAAAYSADRAGGLATPDSGFAGLSQHLGPVPGAPADLATLATGAFDPATIFADPAATLFGTVPLQDLVVAFTGGAPAPADHYPKLRTTPTPTGSVTTLDWTPALREVDLAVAKFTPRQPTMTVQARFERRLDGTAGDSEVTGRIEDAVLDVLGVLKLHLAAVAFSAHTGRKPEVDVQLAPDDAIAFEGALSFVETIRELVPPGVFGDGPHIDLQPTGVDIGYTLALPPAAVGVFALKDLALSTALHLPFTAGRLTFRFAVSSREHPFVVAVGIFGGGGFFGLQLGLDGLDLVEASFEFGGMFALDIGVASGSVSLVAGIYLRGDRTGVLLEGFVRVDGSVSVLGLITVTVTFLLSLSYDTGSGEARGQATLTVGVHIAFFSTSVSLTIERSFGSHAGDPTFGQTVSESDWAAYGAAFA